MKNDSIHRLLDNAYRACSIGVFTPNEVHMSPETFRHFMTWKVQTLDPRKLLARFADRTAGNDLAFVMASFENAGARLNLKLADGIVMFVNTRPVQDPVRGMEYAISIPAWDNTVKPPDVAGVGPDGQFHIDVDLDGKHVHSKSLDTPLSTTVTTFGGFFIGLRAMFAWFMPRRMWPKVKFTVSGSPAAERVIKQGDYTWNTSNMAGLAHSVRIASAGMTNPD